jgi:hypothetical protein
MHTKAMLTAIIALVLLPRAGGAEYNEAPISPSWSGRQLPPVEQRLPEKPVVIKPMRASGATVNGDPFRPGPQYPFMFSRELHRLRADPALGRPSWRTHRHRQLRVLEGQLTMTPQAGGGQRRLFTADDIVFYRAQAIHLLYGR